MLPLQRRRLLILQAKRRAIQKNKQKPRNFKANSTALSRAISMQKNTTSGRGGGGCSCGK